MTNDELFALLSSRELNPKRSGRGWISKCPSHDDRSPSLSSRVADGKLLLYCHAGCPFEVVRSALGIKRATTTYAPPRKPVFSPTPNMALRWKQIVQNSSPIMEAIDTNLGLTAGSLSAVGCVWSIAHNAIAAPMYDGTRSVVGVRLRSMDGRKWAVQDSTNGLFVAPLNGGANLYIAEGLTDSAALAGLGLDVVGRASCQTGTQCVIESFKASGKERAIIVPDNDDAGMIGAAKLEMEMRRVGIDSKIMRVPCEFKDAREWVASGAGYDEVEFVACRA